VELVADLEADQPSPGSQFLQEPIWHIPWDVIELPQPVMSGNHRVRACINGLRYRFVGSMRNIDHHSQPIHLGNQGSAACIQTMPTRWRTATVSVSVLGIMGGKLIRTEAHLIETAQHSQVAITIQTSLHV